jgi:single-strand DNA-binding protein
MAALNKVMLMGNLTRDPQLKQLPSNTQLAEFGLAVSRRYKTAAGEDREETCFVDCTAFGKQAEVIGQYCQKGKPLFVEGRLKYDSWDDKQGFGRRSKVSVVVENFQFIGNKEGSGNASLFNPGQTPTESKESRPTRPRRKSDQPLDEAIFQEADIPF